MGGATPVPFLLVGTQMDLRTDPATITNLEKKTKKPISKTQGEKLAADLGAEMYVECSALTGEGMKNVFDEVTMASKMMMRKLVMVMIIAFKQSFMKYWGNQSRGPKLSFL